MPSENPLHSSSAVREVSEDSTSALLCERLSRFFDCAFWQARTFFWQNTKILPSRSLVLSLATAPPWTKLPKKTGRGTRGQTRPARRRVWQNHAWHPIEMLLPIVGKALIAKLDKRVAAARQAETPNSSSFNSSDDWSCWHYGSRCQGMVASRSMLRGFQHQALSYRSSLPLGSARATSSWGYPTLPSPPSPD